MEFTQILTFFSSLFPPSNITVKKSLPLTVMILSPHPDDESITGSLALRLLHENSVHIINVAVTLGSNKERQKARLCELTEACAVLDFELTTLDESWKKKEKELKSLIQKYNPSIIIAPHTKDFHPTHIKTGELLKKILKETKLPPLLVVWTEFWGQLKKPNLLIEIPVELVELQMQALSKHIGEINRNPYHLRLPGWMMDNVRRGSEILQGKGSSAAEMAFGVLYQIQICKNKKISNINFKQSIIKSSDNLGQMFKLILDAASGSKTKVK